jgi:murein DD-endopeptidase MepM/ murein hydrolase activator NlpD
MAPPNRNPSLSHPQMKSMHQSLSQNRPKRKWLRRLGIAAIAVVVLGCVTSAMPEPSVIPVVGASAKDWHPKSFWHPNWGASVVHKGIDIFGRRGQPLAASNYGIVVYQGELKRGGKVVAFVTPKLRLHYYAHLDEISTGFLSLLHPGEIVGTMGNTGNAAKTPPHLHYSIITLVPHPWRWDGSTMGWMKMFFLDPHKILIRQ